MNCLVSFNLSKVGVEHEKNTVNENRNSDLVKKTYRRRFDQRFQPHLLNCQSSFKELIVRWKCFDWSGSRTEDGDEN